MNPQIIPHDETHGEPSPADKPSDTPRTDNLVRGGAWGHGEANGVEKRGCTDEAFAIAQRIIGMNSFADPYTLALWIDHAWALERLTPPSAGLAIIDMLLFCPRCGLQHVDSPEPDIGWTNPPHATHTCKGCGLNWRPSNALTNGAGSLPAAEEKHVERMKASDPLLYKPRSATEGRSIELIGLALDRMIESLDADIASEDPGNHATIGGLVGERNGLKMARELVRRSVGPGATK